MKNIFFLFILFPNYVLPQIDTSVWYPLDIGNYWEYKNGDGSWMETYEVVNDTLMPNGKTYAKVQYNNSGFYYQRVEDNSYVYFYDSTTNTEYKFYDFVIPEDEYWEFGRQGHLRFLDYNSATYNEIFADTLKIKKFVEHKFVPDTIGFTFETIAKGIGPIIYGWYNTPDELDSTTLVGSIINGIQYGQITSTEKGEKVRMGYSLKQNYPNPFNPSTIINYSIAKEDNVEITVYDISGRIVKKLVNEIKPAGNHSVLFNAVNYASGIYFYQLNSANFSKTKCLVLLR